MNVDAEIIRSQKQGSWAGTSRGRGERERDKGERGRERGDNGERGEREIEGKGERWERE